MKNQIPFSNHTTTHQPKVVNAKGTCITKMTYCY